MKVKPSEETNQEYGQEEEAVEDDGTCNRTRNTAELRKAMVEENAEDDLREGDDTAKMEEPCGERNREEEEEEDDESSHTSFLAELNLLIVALSLFSASTEESLNDEERIEVRRSKNHEEKVSAPRLQQTRVRKMDELKSVSRQTPAMRFQTTIKDSRHGRKF